LDPQINEDAPSRFQEYFSETVESASPKITDTLLTFLELKKVDEELTVIEEEKGDLPESIDEIKDQIESIDTELSEKKQSRTVLEDEKTQLENDNSGLEKRIDKYDDQKFNVRSNKEYDEIVKAIDASFEEVKKNESRIKEIDKGLNSLNSELEISGAKIEELKKELDEKQKLLDELNEQYKQEESVLSEKRVALISKLNGQNSALYERINRMYKGEATAVVRKGNCSGCYNSIPPQRVIEIRAAEKIFTCQSCGRILISEELIS
jgi:predicted  nucleic acid-binding Zn-ribbon protein